MTKKKKQHNNYSNSILNGLFNHYNNNYTRNNKAQKTLPRLRTDMKDERDKLSDRFGIIETITPSFRNLSLQNTSSSPKNNKKKKYKKYIIKASSSVVTNKKKKKLKLKKRQMVDKQFKNALQLTRKWDTKLDILLAKYHLQNFADEPKGNRTTF